ncbi:MAG: rhodanese-like domain-containing protein [Bryobacteraceae bacterium]
MPVPLELSPREVRSRLSRGDRLVFIDVREPEEFAVTRIAGAELVPMQSVPAEIQRLKRLADDACLVILCHHGVRSLQIVSWFRQQRLDNCFSLAGGIDRWSREIDPTVPRY